MARYHTNLAAEFYVLSCLHRIGLDAHLTLGNVSRSTILQEGTEYEDAWRLIAGHEAHTDDG